MNIELLAPAKDKICAKTAIDYGADAVYIGASEFGARKNAPNSFDDIKEIVVYAHQFNVKVYVTLNTILTDDEIIRAKELIKKLNYIEVDAIIIQDLGLLETINELNIISPHASTQCDNRTVEKVKFLEESGFSRVILARELSIEQIKEIKRQTNVELETFIHGALCVSYSGQCYLSYAIGGRSANRGECAQPCRKRYSLMDEEGNFIAKDKYLLNLKDFNASKYIKKLAEAGVNSFKIEGRLKDENYVKNVVGYYRKLIDSLGYKKTSSGKILFDFEPDLKKSFNREFTDYFLDKRDKCFSFESSKSRGEYIGKVLKVAKDSFEINAKLNPQDGLCFLNNDEMVGCLVNKAEGNRIYPNKMDGIKAGTEIYRNFDSAFEKKLKNSKTCRKVGVNVIFNADKITAIDEDNYLEDIKYEVAEIAQNQEKMGVNIINQFKKSGDTIFLVETVKINTDKVPFLPVSKLNELRRELLDKLLQKRKIKKEIKQKKISVQKNIKYPQSEIDYRGNVLNRYAREFYDSHGCKVIEPALESGEISKTEKTVMTCKHCLKYAFNMCKSPKRLYLLDDKGKKYKLNFDCDKCEMKIIF